MLLSLIERLFGEFAKKQLAQNPKNTIFDLKRLIGHKYEDKEIQENLQSWPFKVIKDPKYNKPKICVNYENRKKHSFLKAFVHLL